EKKIVEVTAIILSTKEMKLTEGETATLIATIQPADATDKSLNWTSSDESIATVSDNGEVTAVKAGTATITVSAANGVSATCTVTVESGIIGVASVTLDKTELSLTEGESATLTATVNPADATDKTLSWTSSDESVATVSANGEVTAINAGTATIIVSSANGKTATCTVTVEAKVIEVASVVLDQSELSMTEGESATLTATVNPEDATDKSLTWTSSDESVATVSANGEVKALKAGTATITVTSANGKSASCTVKVEKKIVEVTAIILSTKEMKLTEGETATLIATIQPADATDKSLNWTSSDESVATVSASGEIKAIKFGTATITVSAANGVSATCTVTVESGIIGVASVTLDKTELSLTEGESATLTATVNPADATDKTLSWTSSDESVATVSANGEVKAIQAGTATIIVSSSNGKTATCTVTVAAKVIEVASVALDKTELSMTEGESTTLTATVNPSDATDKSLTWTSSDESVATVSADGEVKALKAGTATITVTSANGKSARCTVKVEKKIVEVTAIILSTKEMKLTEGETATLIATIQPADATDKSLNWTSSDESVATVSASGEIKAIKFGTATITVSAANGVSATCTVTVESGIIGVASVTLDKNELSLTEGESATLTATVNPADATDKTLSWTSSDESVATVSANGEVTAINAGTATIMVSSSNGKTDICVVTVEAKVIEIEDIILSDEELSLEVGDSYQLTVQIVPADATFQDLEWWIDDETIAHITNDGLITVIGEGKTTIHVRSVFNNEIEASCKLNTRTEVANIIQDDADCDVYDLNGKLLKKAINPNDLRNLDKGLYIIIQGNRRSKIMI
ncbi:MAG: Ig-like domain-containing protein, partial [Muribaculaceae bacterium]|nr:Ig-like domain-containing protein [Muribaculaceae bacterium]